MLLYYVYVGRILKHYSEMVSGTANTSYVHQNNTIVNDSGTFELNSMKRYLPGKHLHTPLSLG